MKKGCLVFVLWIAALVMVALQVGSNFGALAAIGAVVVLLAIIVILYRPSIYVFMAQISFDKDHDKGFMWFEKAYKTERMKLQGALFYAYLLLRDGRLERSAEIIDRIIKMKKAELSRADYFNARLNRALIKWKSGDSDGAIEMIQEIYDNDFKNTAVYGVLGYLYIEKGDYQKALEINNEAVEYNDEDNIIADNYALNLLRLGKVDEAEKLYDELIAKEPNFIEPYYNYGTLLEGRGEKESAKEYYEKALSYPEKFLSTVSHKEVRERLDSLR